MKVLKIVFASFVILFLSWNLSYAFGGRSEGCCQEKNMAKKILFLKDKLGLSEEQVEKLTKLSFKAQKQQIKDNAEIGVAQLELVELLADYTVDEKGVTKAIDKLYDLKKKAKKNLVTNNLEVRAILTKEQFEKIKEVLTKHFGMRKRHPEQGMQMQRMGQKGMSCSMKGTPENKDMHHER